MQPVQEHWTRNLWSCALVLACWTVPLAAESNSFEDAESNLGFASKDENVRGVRLKPRHSETQTRVAKRRISLSNQHLLIDAAEIIDPANLDDVAAKNAKVVELRERVQLWLNDDTLTAIGDHAVLVIRKQDDADVAVQSVNMTLTGNVRWTCGVLAATGNKLHVTIRSDNRAVPPYRVTDFTLRGTARLDGGEFIGTADQIDVKNYPVKSFAAESSVRVILDENATLARGTRSSTNKSKIQGRHIEFEPSKSLLQVR